jgi:3-phosphoshikimate 1-carboxyvinyltransferase
MQRFIVAPGQSFQGIATVPGDKSISHRAVMLGAIARGTTTISGFLYGTDCLATVDAFRAMGVDIQLTGSDVLQVIGAGHGGLAASAKGLDLGNSGTSIRLLMGLLVGQRCAASLTGDASLRSRPMERIAHFNERRLCAGQYTAGSFIVRN